MKRCALIVMLLVAGTATASAAETVTTAKLLRQMTDMEDLTRYPEPGYKNVQFSSYDRRSKAPYRSGWYANSDGFGGEPTPGFVEVVEEAGDDNTGTYVMADVKGPGAIVRTWSARIGGTLKLYLDGADEPIYDGQAQKFLQDPYAALGGQADTGFDQREAGYFPIPFAERCRIVWTGRIDRIHFYQIQVRRYEDGTSVRTFKPAALQENSDLIGRVSETLSTPGELSAGAVVRKKTFDLKVPADETKSLYDTEHGPAAISRFTVSLKADNMQRALKRTVLRIYFDGSPAPQVEAPLGDFFGAGPGVIPFSTLPMTVEPDGTMTCRFVMPFAETARIELENWTGSDVRVNGTVAVSEYSWSDDRSMHFHASWRADHGLLAGHRDTPDDIPYLCARGQGLYVGSAAIIMNPTPIPTQYGGWWGEGDEKIWIDGDEEPSIFGTGSEDYYNYAWSSPELFTHAYFAQPNVTGPGNRGYVSNNRWHILDPLPFRESIFFFMELYPHAETPGFSYGRLSYFYAFPDVRDDRVPVAPSTARVPDLPDWTPEARMGANNALFRQAEKLDASATGGEITRRQESMFAGGEALWWKPADAEDTLKVMLPVEKMDEYRVGVTGVLTPASDHVKIELDGTSIYKDGHAVSLHTPHLRILRNRIGDRRFTLDPGRHTLTVQSCDAEGNPTEAPVGIDFLWLVK